MKGFITKVFVCTAIILIAIGMISGVLYQRSPDNVFSHLTPPYEEAAQDFFAKTKDELLQLAALHPTVGDNYYLYYLNMPEMNQEEFPDDILDILTAIEEKTDENYAISISNVNIDISIASGTNYNVLLYYGVPMLHAMDQEQEKSIDLGDGWLLKVGYIVRG